MEEKYEVLIVCGPSGVGKGSLLKELFKKFDQKLAFSVSHTTRKARKEEINGVHYYFVDEVEFKEKIEEGNYFVEYAKVHGNYYGTSFEGIKAINEKNKVCVLEIDVQGAEIVMSEMKSNVKLIYIAPPSIESLKRRLIARGTETEASIKIRTDNAEKEIKWCKIEGNCDEIIVNDNFEVALKNFEKAIKKYFLH